MATEKLRIELQAITAKAEKDIRRFQGSVNKAAKAVQMLGSSGKRSMRPLGEGLSAASVNASEFEKSMAAANARVIAFGASAGLIYQVQRALKETVKATIQVEKSFANINIVLNASQANLQKFGNTLFTIAGQTGQSFRDVSEAATELARQGLSMEKTLSRTKDALILTRLTGMGAVESVESLTAAVNSFSSAGVTSAQVINKMAKVDQAFAVSSEDLAKSIARVGSSAVDAGVSLDQLLAITTAVQQRTARGGAVIGNAFKTIFTRIGRTDVQQKLAAIGVATRDMQGNMLGATQVLQNLSDKFKDLSRNQQNQIAESVAGVFQVNILRAALGDLSNKYGVYNKALLDSATATDEAYKKNEQLNKTLDSLVNKTLANLTKAGSGIGELTLKPALEKVLGSVNEVIESFGEGGRFEKFGQGMGKEILEGLGRFISGPGLAMGAVAIGKLLYNFSKFAKQAVGGIMELNANVANRKNLEALVTQELLKQPDIIARIERNQTTVEKEAADILSLYKLQNTEAEKLKMTTAAIAGEMAAINRSRVAGGGGRAGGSRFGRRRASGFIPNFASEDQERIEASLGGYQAGAIKKMTIPGEGPILYNSAETVKRFPGMTQPAIMPPEGSRAGSAYKTSFSDAHGFDPYKGQGFVPNFRFVIPPKIYRKNPYSQEYDGKLNSRKITDDVERGKLDDKTAATWGYSRAAKKKDKPYLTYDLSRKASMLVPKEGYYNPEVRKSFNSPFQVKGLKKQYDEVVFSAHGLRRDASKHLKNKNSSIAEIIDDSLYSAGKNLLNAFDPEFVKNAKISKNEIETLVDQAGGKGARESLKGAFFEGVIRKLILSKKKSQPLDPTTGTLDTLITEDIKDLFQGRIKSTHGDFKANEGTKLKAAFASQALRNFGASFTQPKRKSKGFVPSFSSAISEAIERERSAGIPSSSIRIGSDSRLSSKANPMGLGVYNTKDEPAGLGQGIDRSIRMGQDPKTHGAAKGFVPNFFGVVAGAANKTFSLAKQTGMLTKAVQGLTKVTKKSTELASKANTFLKEKQGAGGGMGLMGVSMLAQQATGGGNSPMSAVMDGVSWGSTVGMINPLAGVLTGLAVAGYKLTSVTEEQIDMTQAAETALTLLNSAQETASEGFQGITEDLESLGALKISLPTKDIVDFQNEIYNVLSQAEKNGVTLGAESKAIMSSIEEGKGPTTVQGLKELNTQAQASIAKDTRRQTADFELAKSLNKKGFMRLGAEQKIGSTFRTEMQGGYFSPATHRRVKVDKMGQPIIGVETGGEAGEASSIIRGKVIEKFSSGGEDAEKNFAKAYSGLTSEFQNLNNKYSLKSEEELMSDENYLNDLQKSLSGVLGEDIGPEAIKSLLARGKELSSSSDIDEFDSSLDGLQKILKDILSPLSREGSSLDTAGKDFSKAEQAKKATAEEEAKRQEKLSAFRQQRVGASMDARRALFHAKNYQALNSDALNSAKNINLKNAEVEKQIAISDAQSSMNPFGVADASFEAQNKYIRSFQKENQNLISSKYADKAYVAASSFSSAATDKLSKDPFFAAGENQEAFNEQESAIKEFTSLLNKASEEMRENGEISEKTREDMEKQYKKSAEAIDKEDQQQTDGFEVRKAVHQNMLKSLDEMEGISQGFTKENLNINNQVSEMENANERERDIRKRQLENAEKFNSEERDYQLRLKAIRANHLALEADNMANQGRITATEAARRKAAKLEADRDDRGMRDIVSESKASASIGIQESLGYNQRDFVNDIQSSFKEIGDTFKSGMADAIKGMVTGATDFKSAMASVFGSIADKTADKGIEMGIDAMMNVGMKMFQKSSGGPIRKYQTGGLVTGGSGVKDDVLTMMQGGEYVIRKSAVNQIPGGVSTLDAINRSAGGEIPRFAAGGSASLSLKRDFKYTGKDKKRPTGGHFDVDSRMSTLGFFGAQGTKTDMFDRQKRLESYKDYVAQEKKRRADIIAKDLAERKGRLMKAYTSAAMTIGAQALSSIDFGGGEAGSTSMGGFLENGPGGVSVNPSSQVGKGFSAINAPYKYNTGLPFASGGRVPSYALGGSTSGRIPGMVMGGEYIMSPQATQQYGSGFMAQLNRGQLPGFAEGGLVGGEKAGSEDEESKAKETSSTTNNVNISISIDKTGNAETSEGESASEGQNDEDVTKSKEFSQAIKSVVLEEIVKQQRPGGLLRDNDSKG